SRPTPAASPPPPAAARQLSLRPRLHIALPRWPHISLPLVRRNGARERIPSPTAAGLRTPRFSLARRALPGCGGAGSRWRQRLAGGLPAAATATSAAPAALVGRRSGDGFGPRPLGPRRWDG